MSKKEKSKKKYRFLKIFGKILLGLVIFILLLLLFVRSPWGQNIIVGKVVSYISGKTHTEVAVKRLFITFSGAIKLEGLYLEDTKGDTLLYSRDLEADVPLWPIIRGNGIAINDLKWSGVRANISRQDSIKGFNFQFLIDSFVSADSTETAADTTSKPLNLQLGDFRFKDFKVNYTDAVSGITAGGKFQELHFNMKKMNLEAMHFEVKEVSLHDADISYMQDKPFPENEDSTEAPTPYIYVDNLALQKVKAEYKSVPDGLSAQIAVSDFMLDNSEIQMATQEVEIDKIELNDSRFAIASENKEKQEENPSPKVDDNGFQWPHWIVSIPEVSLKNNSFQYFVDGAAPKKGFFNPDAIEIQDFSLEGRQLFLKDQSAGLALKNLTFEEASGIDLEKLKLDLNVDEQHANLQDLVLLFNKNNLEGHVSLQYKSIDELLENPENSQIDLEINRLDLWLETAFRFQPELRNNEYILALSKKKISGNVKANGKLSNVNIPSLNLQWGPATRISAAGNLQNPMDTEKLKLDFPKFQLVSTRTDLNQLVPEDSLGVQFPEKLKLYGNFKGSLDAMEAVATLETSEGNVALTGNFSNQQTIQFQADLQTKELQLGKILQNPELGDLNFSLTASGNGENVNTLDANLEAIVNSFKYNNYPIKDLKLTGTITDGSGPVTMDYKDDNLNMNMNSFVMLDSVAPQVNMGLDILGANLQALGLSDRDIRMAFDFDASFKGNTDSFDVNAEIDDGVTVYDKKTYLLGDVGISARVRPDSTALDVNNQMLHLNLRSNTNPASFAQALQRHIRYYISDASEPDTIEKPVSLQLNADISKNSIIDEVFLPNLQALDTIKIAVDFQEKKRKFKADIDLPYINYSGNEIDSLKFRMDSDKDNMDFNLGFNKISAGPLDIPKTAWTGTVANKILKLDLDSYYKKDTLIHMSSELTKRGDSIYFELDPSRVVLNGETWDVPDNNQIIVSKNNVAFKDFQLSRKQERLEISNSLPKVTEDHIAVSFENFSLSSFMSYFNPEKPLAAGNLDGVFTVKEPFGETGLLADLQIADLKLIDVPLGKLSLDAESLATGKNTFDLAIKEGNLDMDLTGGFEPSEVGAKWDTQLELKKVEMAVIEGFSFGELSNSSGSFSGKAQLTGTFADPNYSGELHFNEAQFTVSKFNEAFKLPQEELKIDTTGLYFENFEIQDANSNSLVLDGSILTENMLNPGFDVHFKADNFHVLNSTEEDFELFYGTASFDAEGDLTGDLDIPVVNAKIDIGSDTDLTYTIPESELDIIDRDGIVVFVNRENPNAILTKTSEDEQAVKLTGFEVNSIVSVDKDAVFKIILDKESGDNFEVYGKGELNFNVSPNGRTTLSGRYEMDGGHYEMSLYGLVKRRFDIAPSSSITWAGDPFDANLDVSAIYKVETSASSLMAAQTSGSSSAVSGKFRQELPFLVYLNVDGELMHPKVSFNLDMPEEEQGAIGGQVYGRIQQLNQQENELNKQVFSLLVLNKFFPQSLSDGGSGGTLTMARDNLNEAISDQLNMFSGQVLGETGIELNFDVDSFTDYQGDSPEDRTQLDITAQKKLLDDRLIVSVGSEVDIQGSPQEPGESTPLIGNVSIEYLLTKNGKLRLKGFRKKEYENVIEGQTMVSGLALIFIREFNKLKEIWTKAVEEELNKKEEEK